MKFTRGGLLIFQLFFVFQLCNAKLVILEEDNWEQMLTGEWMVEFYAPWCPACRALEPVWKDFASWSDDLGIKVGQVDVTTAPGLSGRFMVTALPTIYHVKDGVFRQYRGSRDKEEFISFIEDKRWEAIEEIPSWKAPSSVQMSLVSGFFKLSMLLRNVHTHITETHGIPYWGSYLLFALATIVIGAVLGLFLVFVIDCFYPTKIPARQNVQQTVETKDEQEEDDGEIIDENESEGEDEVDTNADEPEEAKLPEDQSSSSDVRKRRTRKAD